MTCPKCRAKVGVVQEAIATNSGIAYGGICYMCGHWIQENSFANRVHSVATISLARYNNGLTKTDSGSI